MEEADVTEANIEKAAELVTVTSVASTVIKLELTLAVLFDSKLSGADNVVSEEIFHCKEGDLEMGSQVLSLPRGETPSSWRVLLRRTRAETGLPTVTLRIIRTESSLDQFVIFNVKVVRVSGPESYLTHCVYVCANGVVDFPTF